MTEAGLAPAAFCDIDASLAEARRDEFGASDAPVFTEYAEMLADDRLDIIAVCTPPAWHLEQTVAALEAGKYVYSEKPVAARLEGFHRIFAAEESGGRAAFFTPCRYRANEGQLMKAYIDEGRLGEVYRVDVRHLRGRGRPGIEFQPGSRWFLDRSKAITGISGDMGLYFMDRVFYLTDWPEITSVAAQNYRIFPHDLPEEVVYDVEEHMVFLARTAGNLTFTFEFGNISHHPYTTDFTLLGTGGALRSSGGLQNLELRTERAVGQPVVEKPAYKDGPRGDVVVYRELAAAVRGEEHAIPGTTSRQAYQMHRVLHMAFQSGRERREVTPLDVDESSEIFPGL